MPVTLSMSSHYQGSVIQPEPQCWTSSNDIASHIALLPTSVAAVQPLIQITKCWSQSRDNSLSHIAPMYHNVLAQTSQINFLQQQQQQQQSNNQQQPMSSQQYYCYPANQQGGFPQNQYGQSYQQDPYGVSQPQQQQIPRPGLGNIGQSIGHQAYNPPSIMQTQPPGYGSLPAHILEQIRPYIGTPGPIFILPNNCPAPVTVQQPSTPASLPMSQGCPGLGINCPSTPLYCPASSCYTYPMAMSLVNPFASQHSTKEATKNCGCCSRRGNTGSENRPTASGAGYTGNDEEEHQCRAGSDETVCTRRNCPSAINLQALASQLLSIQGIIPCAATRLVLRRVRGSNVTTTTEDTIERAKRSLSGLTQEQLLAETRNARQVNALINLHMTANPPPNVVPILTTVQLKVNLLKAHVDSSINRRISESQGVDGAVGNRDIDPVILAMKSDQELRDLLTTLRQKECEERTNLNFAPYQSQRVIAEGRLSNVQNKISQVESEMERRRGAALPHSPIAQQFSDPGWYGYTGDISNTSSFGAGYGVPRSARNYESPDPFRIQVRNPKRLNLQPHVGSPETTYEPKKKPPTRRASRSRKDSDDDECDESPKNSARETSADARGCACDKSSEDESADEAKKKLGGKILVEGDRPVAMSEVNDHGCAGVSVIKLSPNVVIVIDRHVGEVPRKTTPKKQKKIEAVLREAKDDVEREKLDEESRESNETETGRKPVDPEEPSHESKSRTSVEAIGGEKAPSTDRPKRFKWLKKKKKVESQTSGQASDLVPRDEERPKDHVEDNSESEKANQENAETAKSIEENHETAKFTEENCNTVGSIEDSNSNAVDRNRKSEGPEPVREQTVRMITKIDYEPSAFGTYLGTGDSPEKDKVIQERYKGSFTEDSLKSTSTESTADQTPESISLRVEDYEETIRSTTVLPVESKEKPEKPRDKEFQIGNAVIHGEDKTDREENRITERTACSSGTQPPNASRHNDAKELPTKERENVVETDEDLTSGDLSTIGNYVESFGSIISKIATLKLHRVGESSHSLFGESSTNDPNGVVNSSAGESAGSGAGSSAPGRAQPSPKEEDSRKEIGRWRYIKFAEVEESIPNICTGDDSSSPESATFVLPRIKHSVIENKSRGEKYVVIEEPSEERSCRLGEPYRTGRSLLIRSRLKSPQSSSAEKSGPFTLVKSPKHIDKNCLPFRIVSSKSSKKNQCENNRELKSSDKFWIRPDSPEIDKSACAENIEDSIDPESAHDERHRLVNVNEAAEQTGSTPDSTVVGNDERIVEIHDYSTRISSLVTVENTEHTS